MNSTAFEELATYPSSAKDITTCFSIGDELISSDYFKILKMSKQTEISDMFPPVSLAIAKHLGRRRVLEQQPHRLLSLLRARKILSDLS